jgi:hypothetical protein
MAPINDLFPGKDGAERMTEQKFDEEKFNGEIRKFLKKVGITSQIEIETAVRAALSRGDLDLTKPLRARIVLEVDGLELRHVVDYDLALS